MNLNTQLFASSTEKLLCANMNAIYNALQKPSIDSIKLKEEKNDTKDIKTQNECSSIQTK